MTQFLTPLGPGPEVVPDGSRAPARHYSLKVTRDPRYVRAAQRLRHLVFAGELGATLPVPAGRPGGAGSGSGSGSGVAAGEPVDGDRFDDFCEHLVVLTDPGDEVVGTYRLLGPGGAAAAGALYSDGEFELGALAGLRSALVETGRSCVHPDHRGGTVMSLLWAGIGRYLLASRCVWLAGCASVPLADGGTLAAGVRELVTARHAAPAPYRVRPRRPWPPGPSVGAGPSAGAGPSVGAGPSAGAGSPAIETAPVRVPALLRGYLRLGAWVCGEPAHDPDFGTADFFVLLDVRRVQPRYLRFFLGSDQLPDAPHLPGPVAGVTGNRP
jgi:putative hemolysin